MTVSGLVAIWFFTLSWIRGVRRSSTLPVEAIEVGWLLLFFFLFFCRRRRRWTGRSRLTAQRSGRHPKANESNYADLAHSFWLPNNCDWLVITIFTLPTSLPVCVLVSNSTESPEMSKSARLMMVRAFELRIRVFKLRIDSLNSTVRSGLLSGV